MKLIKWLYFTAKIREKRQEIWDKEFQKRYFSEIREGFRVEYDRLKELLDGVTRRICLEKYIVFYTGDSEQGDYEYDIKQLPLSPEEIEALPEKRTEGNRYYKVPRIAVDAKVIEPLEKQAAQLKEQVDQLANNMKSMTVGIEGPLMSPEGKDQSLNGTIDGLYTLIKILKQHRKSL